MNPYEAPHSPAESSPHSLQASLASRWRKARGGMLHGSLLGAKWAIIVSGSLAVATSLGVAGLAAYRASLTSHASQYAVKLSAGLLGFVLFSLVTVFFTTALAVVLGAVIMALYHGIACDSPDDPSRGKSQADSQTPSETLET